MVVGLTFSDEQVPDGFEAHWGDWLGESADPVEDWQSGPFHQPFPPPKGMFCGLVEFVCIAKKFVKRFASFKILPASLLTTLLEKFAQ